MKNLITIICMLTFSLGFAQEKKAQQNTQIVDAACGQCQFGMKDKKGCDLAVRIGDKSYFVDGTTLNDHGDAHAKDGMCSAIRKAEVVGEVKENRFVASSFKLVSAEAHDDHKGHKH